MRPLFVVASLLILSLSPLAQTKPTTLAPQGRIVGTVVNDAGEPIAQARLCFGSFNEHGGGSSCGNPSDERGQFDIQVPLNTNRISAEKPEAGYWSDGNLDKSGQQVKLGPEHATAHVVLTLGAKPGQLSLHVVVKGSGQPIEAFKVRLLVVDDRPFFGSVEIADHTSIPVPPDKDVMVIVQAPGYKRWFYKDAADQGQPTLRLQSGEERAIDAEVEPENAQN